MVWSSECLNMGVDPVQFGLDETREEVVRGEKYLENQSL